MFLLISGNLLNPTNKGSFCKTTTDKGELVLGWTWKSNAHDADAWSSEIRDSYPKTGNEEFLPGGE